ncbi:hypothetical protein [Caldithrix abyssi]
MIFGRGRGAGRGQGPGAGKGRGLGGKRGGLGPAGNCVCPSCGTKVAHQPGTPCTAVKCPKCGAMMVRGEG